MATKFRRHKYPAIPHTALHDQQQMADTILRVREVLETMIGVRKRSRLRMVNVDDLIQLGLITENDLRKLED